MAGERTGKLAVVVWGLLLMMRGWVAVAEPFELPLVEGILSGVFKMCLYLRYIVV